MEAVNKEKLLTCGPACEKRLHEGLFMAHSSAGLTAAWAAVGGGEEALQTGAQGRGTGRVVDMGAARMGSCKGLSGGGESVW